MVEIPTVVREQGKSIVKGCLFLVFILLLVLIVRPETFLGFALILSGSSLAYQIFTKAYNSFWLYMKSFGKTFVIVSIIYIILKKLGGYGIIGILVSVFLYAGYILYVKRVEYMNAVRTIERMLFGESLDNYMKSKGVENGEYEEGNR